jgi:hypothetical protein
MEIEEAQAAGSARAFSRTAGHVGAGPMPSPSARLMPGSLNFSGVSGPQMASITPNHTNGVARCSSSLALMAWLAR